MSESSPACQGPRGPAHAAICSLVAPFHAVVSPLSGVPRGNSVAVSNVRASDSELPRRPPRASLRPAPGACGRLVGWSADTATRPWRRAIASPRRRPCFPASFLQLAFDPGHPISGTPAVDREPRRARAPSADAAGEPRRRDLGPLREPRQQVLELRQRHLQPAVERVACCAKMARMTGVRFHHSQLHALAQVTRRVGSGPRRRSADRRRSGRREWRVGPACGT